jgi:hypothetical protein
MEGVRVHAELELTIIALDNAHSESLLTLHC